MIAVSEQLSLKAGGLLIQVVSNTGLTQYKNPLHFYAHKMNVFGDMLKSACLSFCVCVCLSVYKRW